MALAPQRGAGLMSLMVGMSIGLGVLLLANEQLRQLGARYRANQARDQETESFRVAWRFLAHHARASGGHSVVLDDGRAAIDAPMRPWSPSGRVAGDQLNGSQPLSMGLAAVDCLGRQTSRNNRIHSSLWVRDGSLRCQVPDRAYNQPLSDGWQRLDVQGSRRHNHWHSMGSPRSACHTAASAAGLSTVLGQNTRRQSRW